MGETLSKWLAQELKNRGWSHRELARRSGLSQTAISTVLSGQRQPGWEFCAAVAGALGEAPEQLMRMGGLLPALPAPEDDATLRDLIEYAKLLSPEERLAVLEYTQWRYQQEQHRQRTGRQPGSAAEAPVEP